MSKEFVQKDLVLYALAKQETIDGQPRAIRRAKKIVGGFPASDVVEVVRCRDCIHLSGVTKGGVFFRCDRYDKWQDESNRVYMPLNGFCSYGHRKGEEWTTT